MTVETGPKFRHADGSECELGKHALRFRMNGIPLFCPGDWDLGCDCGEIHGYVEEPEWTINDVPVECQGEVGAHVVAVGRALPHVRPDLAYLGALSDFGLKCHHPQHRQKWAGPNAWECGICETLFMPIAKGVE